MSHALPIMTATLRGTLNTQNRHTLGLDTPVLLDSGSNNSLISQQLFDMLPAQTRPPLTPTAAQISTATTENTPHATILGKATFHITLTTTNNEPVTTPVHAYVVDNLSEPFFLAESWFQTQCAFRTADHIYMPKDNTTTVTLANAEETCHKVKLDRYLPNHHQTTNQETPRKPNKRPDSPSCRPLPITTNPYNATPSQSQTQILTAHINVTHTPQQPPASWTRRKRKHKKKPRNQSTLAHKKPPDKCTNTNKTHQHPDPPICTNTTSTSYEHTLPDLQWYPLYIKQPSRNQHQAPAR